MAVQAHTPPRLTRIARRADAFKVPRPVEGRAGQFVVDATWGTIQPLQLAPGVRTVGELEVIEHIESGMPLVDTRLSLFLATGTIPTAVNIPHPETTARRDEFDPDVMTVLFCNGPQCAERRTPIEQLPASGYPPDRLLYYRGGIHELGDAGGTAGRRTAGYTTKTRIQR